MSDPDQHSNADPAPPRSLKLEFSKAADLGRISRLFDPEIKNVIDPHDHVYKRMAKDFRQAVEDGGAGFLSDENGEVMAITIAYRFHKDENPPPGQPHEYTEFGTSLSRIPGFGSAQLIMAALAIHEWLFAPPSRRMLNNIDNSNAASISTYRDHLGWEKITDPEELEALFPAAYRNVDRDCGAGVGKPPPPEQRSGESFYTPPDSAIALYARILLSYMEQGGLLNKKTGQTLPVDFSGLDDAGLTRTRLEAMAQGVTSRATLLAP